MPLSATIAPPGFAQDGEVAPGRRAEARRTEGDEPRRRRLRASEIAHADDAEPVGPCATRQRRRGKLHDPVAARAEDGVVERHRRGHIGGSQDVA